PQARKHPFTRAFRRKILHSANFRIALGDRVVSSWQPARQLPAVLYLIWTASEADEWLDQTLWIPF
ncbi:MAG: hypothetical protein ACP5J4_07645, partial [Anaerolineae bacterium]